MSSRFPLWINEDKVVPEVHSGGWPYDIRVCIGTTNVVVIDKLYGPLVARTLRISLEGGEWVIERQTDVEDPKDDAPPRTHWIEFARIPIDDGPQ